MKKLDADRMCPYQILRFAATQRTDRNAEREALKPMSGLSSSTRVSTSPLPHRSRKTLGRDAFHPRPISPDRFSKTRHTLQLTQPLSNAITIFKKPIDSR